MKTTLAMKYCSCEDQTLSRSSLLISYSPLFLALFTTVSPTPCPKK